MSISPSIVVSQNESKNPQPTATGEKPSHWNDAAGSCFSNPWPSFRKNLKWEAFTLLPKVIANLPTVPNDISSLVVPNPPKFGSDAQYSEKNEKITTTWLGHACFLVEFPSRNAENGRGIRILFDPVFSDRCGPTSFLGPKRYTPPPCTLEDIPDIDAVVISHNHYDHLDTETIKNLVRREYMPHFFAPLGNDAYFKSLSVPETHTHIMDWWDSKKLTVKFSDSESKVVDITCTPCQHMTGRSVVFTDQFKSLWASWSVEEVIEGNLPSSSRPPVKVFFGGDTGYSAVKTEADDDDAPVCPVFKEIGSRFGAFDFAMIPIGAYKPRQVMSPVHASPHDSVRIFKDIKAKKALGMHWGTWVLTTEPVWDPPKDLKDECEKIGIAEGDFGVCQIGATSFF